VLFIVRSGERFVGDRGSKKSTYKGKDPLSFETWIFRHGQPDCDDDRRIFVAMILTLEQCSLV
jgi:hypothetical protein